MNEVLFFARNSLWYLGGKND